MTRFALSFVLLSSLFLAGCGGDAAANDPPANAPGAGAPTTETPPAEPAASFTQAPTPIPSPTPYGNPTATAVVIPTAVPLVPTTPEKEALLALLFTTSSLPYGWLLTDLRFSAEPSAGRQELCDLHTFPGWAEQVDEVEAKFLPASGGPESLTQSVALYPLARADEAMQFIEQQLGGCNVWTGYQSRFTFVIEPFDYLVPDSNVLAYRIRFTVAGSERVESELVYFQVGNFITTFSYGGPEGSDLEPMRQAVRHVIAHMEAIL